MRTAGSTTLTVLCLGVLLAACGSGASHKRLAAASTPPSAPDTTVTTGPTTSAAAPTTPATGPPTTKASATATTAATVARTIPPTAAPRPTTTAPQVTTTAAAQAYTFHERDDTFSPSSFQVAAGTRVTIVNDGPSYHTWTSDTGAWDSGTLSAGATYSHTFTTPGTFAFKCDIHSAMQGSVTVT